MVVLGSPFSTFSFVPQMVPTGTKRSGLQIKACLDLVVQPLRLSSMPLPNVDFSNLFVFLKASCSFSCVCHCFATQSLPLSVQSCFIPSSFNSCSVSASPMGCSVWSSTSQPRSLSVYSVSMIYTARVFLMAPVAVYLSGAPTLSSLAIVHAITISILSGAIFSMPCFICFLQPLQESLSHVLVSILYSFSELFVTVFFRL